MPKVVRRSACDRCRAKRVRCPRAENSTAPCARCVHVGASCVTGSPGQPGRPRKAHIAGGATPSSPPATAADLNLPECWSIPRAGDDVELRIPAPDEPSTSAWFEADGSSWNILDDLGQVDLMLSEPAVNPPKAPVLPGFPGQWTAFDDNEYLGYGSAEECPAPDNFSTLDQSITSSRHQDTGNAAGDLDVARPGLGDIYDEGSFLISPGCMSRQGVLQHRHAAKSLRRYAETMERRVAAVGAVLSDPLNIVKDCAEKGCADMATENPLSIVLNCTKEFVDIIQNLTKAPRSPASEISAPDRLILANAASSAAQNESIDTETTLLILSSYIALMRLYDSLFHDVYHRMCQIPANTIKEIKVKSVLRIGGISSLQDMPGKAYAIGVVEVIRSHIRTLEHSMGLPAAYCLSGETNPAHPTKGVFTDEKRASLFHTVMAQEDVRSRGGSMSYVESIRENIKNSLSLFDT
ncbi:hypothetical protein JX266_013384 [Neoarthrinium moseri]|nr:hypothetical protein JX266_013384 [Neoarthrinium moseri]